LEKVVKKSNKNVGYMIAAISGGSGYQGSAVKTMLSGMGYEVISLSRKDLYARVEALAERLQGAGLVVHLAGAPIIGRWTKKYRKEIYDSRIVTTRNIVKAMDLMSAKPDTFICASAVGIYPTGGDFTEENKAVAENFLGKVCADWEAEAEKAPPGVRVLNFRFGIVLGKGGGALPKLMLPFRFFVGGRLASGKQIMSWIHLEDVLGIFKFVIENTRLSGPVNISSPNPVSNNGLAKTLGKTLGRPALMPVPEFALKLVLGKGAIMLTEGQAVRPKKLLDSGYTFKFPELKEALEDLLK
jgi:uncharacterized protein